MNEKCNCGESVYHQYEKEGLCWKCGDKWCDQEKKKLPPVRQRVRAALSEGPMEYYALAAIVYPQNIFKKAWRGAIKGGPPGLVMAFSAMLRRMEDVEDWNRKAIKLSPRAQEDKR